MISGATETRELTKLGQKNSELILGVLARGAVLLTSSRKCLEHCQWTLEGRLWFKVIPKLWRVSRKHSPSRCWPFTQGRPKHNHNHNLPKRFCIWCHTKTAFDGTSDEKSLWFLCAPLCRRGIWCVIRGWKNEKWGPARWTQKWSWSWLGRPLFTLLQVATHAAHASPRSADQEFCTPVPQYPRLISPVETWSPSCVFSFESS